MYYPAFVESALKKPSAGADKIIQRETMNRLHYFSQNRDQVAGRLRELDKEWDIERALETVAPSVILLGLGLSQVTSKKWLFLSASIAALLLKHGIKGRGIPHPILRSMGFRTVQEIDEERYALKILRGDFDNLSSASGYSATAEVAYDAVHNQNERATDEY